MKSENAEKFKKLISGLLMFPENKHHPMWASIEFDGYINSAKVIVYKHDMSEENARVVVRKILYLDNKVDEDIEEIETKVNKALSEVLGHGN